MTLPSKPDLESVHGVHLSGVSAGSGIRKKARAKIQQYGRPNRHNDVAESAVAKTICSIFGWKFLVQLRLLKQRLKSE